MPNQKNHFLPPTDAAEWREIFLIVRPEEKITVERALMGVVPPLYVTFPALGRGRHGGLAYENRRGWIRWPWGQHPKAALLPKVVFHLVVSENHVDEIINSIQASLRLKGGPPDWGLGLAIVSPVEADLPILPRAKKVPGENGADASQFSEAETGKPKIPSQAGSL